MIIERRTPVTLTRLLPAPHISDGPDSVPSAGDPALISREYLLEVVIRLQIDDCCTLLRFRSIFGRIRLAERRCGMRELLSCFHKVRLST